MMTHQEAELLEAALAGAHAGDDKDVAIKACLQAAAELEVLEEALIANVSTSSIAITLGGIQGRLRAAAFLAGEIELGRDHGERANEAPREQP